MVEVTVPSVARITSALEFVESPNDAFCPIWPPEIARSHEEIFVHRVEVPSTRETMEASSISEVGIYTFKNVFLYNSYYIYRDGMNLHQEGVYPSYQVNRMRSGDFSDAREKVPDLPVRAVEGPVAVILSTQSHIYGHFLLEMLAKVHVLQTLRSLTGIKLSIVVEKSAPKFVRTFITSAMPEADVIEFDKKAETLQIETALVPTLLGRNHSYHSAMAAFAAGFRSRMLEGFVPSAAMKEICKCPGFFISRKQHRVYKRWDTRFLMNEEDLEKIAVETGFVSVEPQLLSIPEQMYLFANAKMVVGEFSSALHNTLFSTFGTTVVAIDKMNEVQACIARLHGHRLHYILPDSYETINPPHGTAVARGIRIDEAHFRAVLRECVEAA